MTTLQPMDQHTAADALLKYVYSGILGSTKGMGVQYALLHTTDSTFSYLATLEPIEHDPLFILTRYQIEIDRQTGNLSAPMRVEITDEDMGKVILAATNETILSSSRFTDGGFSISYKVTTNRPDAAYVVQLRYHGNVASMNALMKFVRTNNKLGVIPMPTVYPIPGEAEHQRITGFGRQITEFVPGVIAERVYPDMPHAKRLEFVRKVALAWQACWDLPLPSPRRIGELIATENNEGSVTLTIGPDRHYSLGGPFTSVRDWLEGRLRQAVASLERSTGIDDFKEEYMAPIKRFVDTRLNRIPDTVEECSVVAIHVDMGLHNMLVSTNDHTELKAIIDWEFCASAPFLAAYECIEMLFRQGAPNGFGAEYPQGDQLREAFWDAIPKWKARWESQKDFMEWYRFALFLKPRYCSGKVSKAKKMEFWAENVRVVERMLEKYGIEKG